MQQTHKIFNTIGIIGVGLIGGSLGMAIRRNGIADNVIGFGRSEQKLMKAKILGAVDEYSTSYDKITETEFVIICTPVNLIADTLRDISKFLKPGTIVTDAGSTKREVVNNAKMFTPHGCFFLGGHPMAGSEQTGVEAAKADLFIGATYVLTPDDSTPAVVVGRVAEFVETLGANLEMMDPYEHDRTVAVISHLPHVMSAALLFLAESEQRKTGKPAKLAAGSFRDLTRVSGSSPDIWRDICLTNGDTICKAIEELQKILADFKDDLLESRANQIHDFFDDAREFRKIFMRISK